MNEKSRVTAVFDLESIGNPKMFELLPPIEADSRLKDPVKIEADIVKKKEKQWDMLGVNPHTNIICCATIMDADTGESWTYYLDHQTYREDLLLLEIWGKLSEFGTFVTFNGMSFDVECLKFHSMMHSIPKNLTVDISQHKYSLDSNHIDIRMRFARNNEFAKGTLDFFSRIITGKGSDDKGSNVQKWWNDEEHDKIKAHCQSDVEKLWEIYNKIYDYYV